MKRVALQHADWLNLIEPQGAYLTLPVLRRVFPQGLEVTPRETRSLVREALEALTDEPAARTAWLRLILYDLLDLGARLVEGAAIPHGLSYTAGEYGVTLRPDLVLMEPAGDGEATARARLLICQWPLHTDLGRRPGADAAGRPDRWAASPIERAATLCRATDVPLALVTDTDQFVLVWAPRNGASGSATWPAALFGEERTLLDSFVSLLNARRFFGVGPGETLEALFRESANAQSEVTNQLGFQVRQAVELLTGAISRADLAEGGALFADLPEPERAVYSAVVSVMMRLVFLLTAEERRLFPLEDQFYLDSYAVSSLREQLQTEADRDGHEALERRTAAWHRLLATFRAVFGGIQHERLRLPAYGGDLFDPDRHPFLEGRRAGESWREHAAEPLPVDDRTVLAMLDALQVLTFREGGVTEARRVSYRSLDIEQIGHVYEGLLDHGCRRARRIVLGLVGRKGEEPEIGLEELEQARAGGEAALVAYLAEQSGRTANFLKRLLATPPDLLRQSRLRAACDNDAAVYQRLLPFASVLRDDLRGLPTVFLPGALYVTQSSEGRDSGTRYTPKDLADEVVRYALEPVVYEPGPAETADAAQWKLKSAAELLKLKVCDPAVGSGAILVAACRYLAERLVEAWAAEAGTGAAPAGLPGPAPEEERELLARRVITDHCLFGVDRNPMAAEMAKLSLWLTTMARERPFTFLDHAIHAGDSLLGITGEARSASRVTGLQAGDPLLGITNIDQLKYFHMDPERGKALFGGSFFNPTIVISPRLELAMEAARQLDSITVFTLRDAAAKQQLHTELTEMLAPLRIIADLIAGAPLATAGQGPKSLDQLMTSVSTDVLRAFDETRPAPDREAVFASLAETAAYWLNEGRPRTAPIRVPLHWPLAFPEVFLDPTRPAGFDVMVGNPPFLGGQRITGAMGTPFRDFLVEYIAGGRKGSADLVAYFFLRCARIGAAIGMLATNTIAQGDTREVGLDWLLGEGGWSVNRAVKSRPWPGKAGLEVSQLWMSSNAWEGEHWLDSQRVDEITSTLDRRSRAVGKPYRLTHSADWAFTGSYVLGMGFLLTHNESQRLLASDHRNAETIFPFLNGEDLNDSPVHEATRRAINFFDWSLERSESYSDCMKIIREKVKPERDRVERKARRERWWQFAERAPGLYSAIEGMQRVLAISSTSKVVQPIFVATGQVFSHALSVFAYDDDFHFGVLSSTFHWWWAVAHASTLETRIRYTPTDCFETFPQPPYSAAVEACGKALDDHRRPLMIANDEGLTKTYNRVHNAAEQSAGIVRLRELHRDLDLAVAVAYGWSDLALDHGFHDTSQGLRYTIGPAARTEVLDRLLELNHQRYAEEVAAGLHEKKKGPAKRGTAKGKRLAPMRDMFAPVEGDA